MVDFDQLIKSVDRAVFQSLSTPAQINGQEVRVVFDRGVVREPTGYDLRVNDYEIRINKIDTPAITEGDTVVISGVSYRVAQREEDDGYIQAWALASV